MYYYCERTAQGLLSEPLNSITNLAFIIISILILKRYRGEKYSVIFGSLIGLIGIGSFLFHTIPTKMTGLLDIIAILLLILFYLFIINNSVLNFSKIFSLVITLVSPVIYFYIGNELKGSISFLGDSSFYIIILMHLFIIYLFALKEKIEGSFYILLANIIFAISILFRAVDNHICNINFYGTHFLWHILNSLVLYTLVFFIYKNKSCKTASPKIPT